ncbi:MAG: hypothetical protein CVU39_11225 [Chloroflexi bacterium HGW-Chloroflexi-10]|nr:MAG: hypothetical protein CVU39_11225 [Chloroflexi bacterium HGW-Chloroflexi-10]
MVTIFFPDKRGFDFGNYTLKLLNVKRHKEIMLSTIRKSDEPIVTGQDENRLNSILIFFTLLFFRILMLVKNEIFFMKVKIHLKTTRANFFAFWIMKKMNSNLFF